MIIYQNVTTKENFQKHIEWANQNIKPIDIQQKSIQEWEISDRFGNVWTVSFNGNVGEFLIENKSHFQTSFVVYLYLSGERIEIVKAVDNGRKIKSDRFLKKYKELALMVSNYFKFNMLTIGGLGK